MELRPFLLILFVIDGRASKNNPDGKLKKVILWKVRSKLLLKTGVELSTSKVLDYVENYIGHASLGRDLLSD